MTSLDQPPLPVLHLARAMCLLLRIETQSGTGQECWQLIRTQLNTAQFIDLVEAATVEENSELDFRIRFALEGIEDLKLENPTCEVFVTFWLHVLKKIKNNR